MRNLNLLLLACSIFFCNHYSTAQSSTNYAGKAHLNVANENFTTPQNFTLKSTYLNNPQGICLDTNGKIYLTHEHRIMYIDGDFLRGRSGAAGSPNINSGHRNNNGVLALWSFPKGIAVDPNTNEVYIADNGNNVIRKLSAYSNASNAQTTSAFAGTYSSSNAGSTDGTLANAKFNLPYDLVVMKNGDIIVTDEENSTIRKISGNNVTTIAGNAAAIGDVDGIGNAARFAYPRGICKKDENNVLIVDYDNGKIKQLNLTTFEVTTIVQNLNFAADVEYINGVIYFTDRYELKKFENNTVTTVAGSANETDSTAGTLAETRFGLLGNLVYSKKDGFLYVIDQTYGIVKKIDFAKDPIVDFSANKTNPTVNQVISITDQTTDRKGTRAWTITPSTYNLVNNSTLTSEKLQLEFSQTGSYTVKLTYTFPGGNAVKEKVGYINVSNINAKPVADFEASFTTEKPNTNINLIDLSSNNPTTHNWVITPAIGVTFQNGTSSASKFPVVSFANEGKYTVKLTVTNAQGNDDETKVDYITIDKNVNSVFGPAKNGLIVYPNPTQNIIKIEGLTENASYKLYSLQGKLIADGEVSTENSIDISGTTNGIYSLIIIDNSGKSYVNIIQKQ